MANHLRAGLAALAAFVVAGAASAGVNLVFNGGFETNSFAGWSVPPNAPPPFGAFFSVPDGNAHDGDHYALMSSWNLSYMSQFLPDTVAGTDYELEFWARLPDAFPPGLGYGLDIRWEGLSVANVFVGGPQGANWNPYSVPLSADISGSLLEFGQASFPGEIHLDSIVVRPVPGPATLPLMTIGSLVAFRRQRR